MWSKWLICLFLIINLEQSSAIFSNRVKRNSAGKVNATDVIKGMIDGGNTIKETMDNTIKLVLTPALEAIRRETLRINLNIDEITSEEKALVTASLVSLYDSESRIFKVKLSLNALASETIKRVKRLTKVFSKLKPDMDETKFRKLITYNSKRMISLLKRSQKLLAEADELYTEIQKDLNKVKAKLEQFRVSIEGILNGPRKDAWILKARIATYGTAAGTCVIPPFFHCLATGAGASLILENVINVYRGSVKRLLKTCRKNIESTTNLLSRTDFADSFIRKEMDLMKKWDGALAEMKDDFDTPEELADFMWDEDGEPILELEDVFTMLRDLKTSCKNYLKNKFA